MTHIYGLKRMSSALGVFVNGLTKEVEKTYHDVDNFRFLLNESLQLIKNFYESLISQDGRNYGYGVVLPDTARNTKEVEAEIFHTSSSVLQQDLNGNNYRIQGDAIVKVKFKKGKENEKYVKPQQAWDQSAEYSVYRASHIRTITPEYSFYINPQRSIRDLAKKDSRLANTIALFPDDKERVVQEYRRAKWRSADKQRTLLLNYARKQGYRLL
tara:strand:- start:7919 stop:8557 length:639 start_codon:yes stop_codon:yes gene_type:complete